MKKHLLKFSAVFLFASALLSIGTLYKVKADGEVPLDSGWIGCSDGNNSPGDRTGCSVQFAGIVNDSRGTSGVYVYTCNGQTTTCQFLY